MTAPQNTIAVVFDFDDTLTDDSTTALLERHHIDSGQFWKTRQAELVNAGYDPTPAYLRLLLENVGDGKPFGQLTNAKLREFGAGLKMYRGLPGLFKDLRTVVGKHKVSNPAIEFYVVSGGLEEIIRGCKIAQHFQGIWGCQFDEEAGRVRHIKRVVSFTEKTKYLHQINKGLLDSCGPYEVNKQVPDAARRVPFGNMIYVGDGLTDVPCFSMLEHLGGRAFGVFDPKKDGSPRKAWEGLVAPRRVTTMNAPEYGPKDQLGALLRMAVDSLCTNLDTRTRTANV